VDQKKAVGELEAARIPDNLFS
jgi:glycogen debranching enzyme